MKTREPIRPKRGGMYFWAYLKNGNKPVVMRWFDNEDMDKARTIARVMDKFVASGFPEAERKAYDYFKFKENK